MYNVVTDPSEHHDLWESLGSTVGDAMFQRASQWMDSVRASVRGESMCTIKDRILVREKIEEEYQIRNGNRMKARLADEKR